MSTPLWNMPDKWKKIILKKEKSPHNITITPDMSMDKDGWFIRFNYMKKEEIISTHLIILKDVPAWVNSHRGGGWEVESII